MCEYQRVGESASRQVSRTAEKRQAPKVPDPEPERQRVGKSASRQVSRTAEKRRAPKVPDPEPAGWKLGSRVESLFFADLLTRRLADSLLL